ncbi:MAG: hypothetical protein DRJ44_00010 [Thermoprotei archaeon]|nr:MAG: hypothetical protein DRJ44_00010 [Thermoprotei archaeon]
MPNGLKILAFSDVHGRIDAVEKFVNDVKRRKVEFDLVVIAGDIGNPQKPKVFIEILKKISELRKPVFFVRGNWDVNFSWEDLDNVYDLDKVSPVYIKEYAVIGHGRNARPYTTGRNRVILITHYPPYGILDKGRKLEAPQNTLHSGLVEINYLVDFYNPIVHIFGHSHSFGGVEFYFNGVMYVNVARLDRVTKSGSHIGNYCIINIEGDKARVNWFYLNGIWKNCSNCRRRVHLPANWRICRRCSRKRELKKEKIPGFYRSIKVKIQKINIDKSIEDLALVNVEIPIQTIKDNVVLHDFVDIILWKTTWKILQKYHVIVVKIPKEKIIETYGKRNDGIVIPFSEYLFSCDGKLYGEKLCALMKLYSLDKRVHVFWGIDNSNNERKIEREYVFFAKKLLEKIDDEAIDRLIKEGFTPLVFEKIFQKD